MGGNGPLYSCGVFDGPDRDRHSHTLRIFIHGDVAGFQRGKKCDGQRIF